MSWNKVNLITLPDGSDKYKCSKCGFTKSYRGFRRDSCCPKCREVPIFGAWISLDQKFNCSYCSAELVICPREGHPNSEFWRHEQDDGTLLFVCPNGCLEDGSKTNTHLLRIKS